MGSRTPEEIVAEFALEDDAGLDTFDAFRGDLFKGDGFWAVAIVNGGVDGLTIGGKPENWIDRFVVVIIEPTEISLEVAVKESILALAIGGETLGDDQWHEIVFQANDARVLLFEDSNLKASPVDSPLSREEAQRFIEAFDFSDSSWSRYVKTTR
jgi:hypothetical protein